MENTCTYKPATATFSTCGIFSAKAHAARSSTPAMLKTIRINRET